MGLGKVDESMDAGLKKGVHAAARGFGIVTAGVFTRQEAAFFNPIGFEDGRFSHKVMGRVSLIYCGKDMHILLSMSMRSLTSSGYW